MITISVLIAIVTVVLVLLGSSVRVITQYERGVVFRFGRVRPQTRGPGLALIAPVADRLHKVNMQIITQPVPAQDGITRDNVTVRVDAVIYYRVVDPVRVAVDVQDYGSAILQVAQASLRSIIGKSELDDLLSNRERLNQGLELMIDNPAVGWGVHIDRVEIKDVALPESMKRSMSRQAEAERERRSRVITAEGELQASQKLAEAAEVMAEHPAALQLRLLQTVVEVAAEKNSTLVLPFPVELLRFLERATPARHHHALGRRAAQRRGWGGRQVRPDGRQPGRGLNDEPERETGRVVVGIDATGSADDAVDWATTEAATRGCPLRVVHAFPAAAPRRPLRRRPRSIGGIPQAWADAEHVLAEAMDRARSVARTSECRPGWCRPRPGPRPARRSPGRVPARPGQVGVCRAARLVQQIGLHPGRRARRPARSSSSARRHGMSDPGWSPPRVVVGVDAPARARPRSGSRSRPPANEASPWSPSTRGPRTHRPTSRRSPLRSGRPKCSRVRPSSGRSTAGSPSSPTWRSTPFWCAAARHARWSSTPVVPRCSWSAPEVADTSGTGCSARSAPPSCATSTARWPSSATTGRGRRSPTRFGAATRAGDAGSFPRSGDGWRDRQYT